MVGVNVVASKSSSSSSSSKKNYGGGSSFLQSYQSPKGTYDASTSTYTDSSGNKFSMSLSNAISSGATFISSSSSNKNYGGGSSSGGGGNNLPTTPNPPDFATAQKQSQTNNLSDTNLTSLNSNKSSSTVNNNSSLGLSGNPLSISVYTPMDTGGQIKLYNKGYGERSTREATAFEKSQAGIGENPYTYTGTKYETPTMTYGDTLKTRVFNEKLKLELEQLKVQKGVQQDIENKAQSIADATNKAASEAADKAYQEYQKTGDYNKYSNRIEDINLFYKKAYENQTAGLNNEGQKIFEEKLAENKSYQRKLNNYKDIVNSGNYRIDEFGNVMLANKLSEVPSEFERVTGLTKEQAADIAVLSLSGATSLTVSPLVGGAIAAGYFGPKMAQYARKKASFSEAWADISRNVEFDKEPTKKFITGQSINEGTIGIKSTPLSEEYQEYRAKEKGYALATLLSVVDLGYVEFTSATKGVTEELALKELNTQAKAGTLKITQENLETGIFKVNTKDYTGKIVEIPIKINNINQIEKYQERVANQLRLKSLGLDKITKTESVSAIEKTNLINLNLPEEFQQSIKEGEIGIAKRINIKTGKEELRYFTSLSQEIDGKGKQFLGSFKINKKGEPYSLKVTFANLKEELSKSDFLTGRYAHPNELKTSEFNTNTPAGKLKIEEIERFKFNKVLKINSNEEIARVLENNNYVLKSLEGKGTVYQVGKNIKGTYSYADLFKNNIDLVYKEIKVTPIEKFKSAIIKKETPFSGFSIKRTISTKLEPFEYNIEKMKNNPKTPFSKTFTATEEISETINNIKNPVNGLINKINNKIELKLKDMPSSLVGFEEQKVSLAPKLNGQMTEVKIKNIPAIKYPTAKEESNVNININQFDENYLNVLETQYKIRGTIQPTLKYLQKNKVIQQVIPKLNQSQLILNAQAIKLDLNSLQKNKVIQQVIPKLNQSWYQRLTQTIPATPALAFAPLGRIGSGGFKDLNKIYQKPSKPNAKYTASLNASVFDITIAPTKRQLKELKNIDKEIFTGFETRPLIDIRGLENIKQEELNKINQEIKRIKLNNKLNQLLQNSTLLH